MKTDDIKKYLKGHLKDSAPNIKRVKKVKDKPGHRIIRSFTLNNSDPSQNAVVITDEKDQKFLNTFLDVEVDISDAEALRGLLKVGVNSPTLSGFYFTWNAEEGEFPEGFIIISKKKWDEDARWDDTDPAIDLIPDHIMVQSMACVYELCESETQSTGSVWLKQQGATENPEILEEDEEDYDDEEEPDDDDEEEPLAEFYFARFLNISMFGDPSTEDDSVILVEKSHWDTHQTWITRAGKSGAELTQEQNRGLPLMPFMHYVHQWESTFEWADVREFLEYAGATENNGLQTTMIMRNTTSEDFVLKAPYPHEYVNTEALPKTAVQIVTLMMTGEEDEFPEDVDGMVWDKPEEFLKWVTAQSKTPVDQDAGQKIIKALHTMMAIDIVWEGLSTTWAMGMSPEGGDENSKQTIVRDILQWATGKLTPADYGRKDDDPSDYLRD